MPSILNGLAELSNDEAKEKMGGGKNNNNKKKSTL